MYPKLKINVYFIFLNIGDFTFGNTLVLLRLLEKASEIQISYRVG
jgi:hypothetical protein